jgi:hypothetical protein
MDEGPPSGPWQVAQTLSFLLDMAKLETIRLTNPGERVGR